MSFEIENGVLLKYDGDDTDVIIPDGVTVIGKQAFMFCKALRSVTLPEGVTEIGEWAFCGCKSLGSVTLPEGVTELDEGAFGGCEALTSITLPEGVRMIGEWAFSGCKSLLSVTLPEGVTEIGRNAFSGCKSLGSITLPEGVTEIGDYAFYECSSLKSITIPEGVTEIGNGAFYKCSSLKSITIPRKMSRIVGSNLYPDEIRKSEALVQGFLTRPALYDAETAEDYIKYVAFFLEKFTDIPVPTAQDLAQNAELSERILQAWKQSCIIGYDGKLLRYGGSDAHVVVPEGVTRIGERAFRECKSLKSITLPDSLTEIGGLAFSGCSSLESITIPEGVTEIEKEVFERCSSLKSIILPEGVTKIGYRAFDKCKSLVSVTFPQKLSKLFSDAYEGMQDREALTRGYLAHPELYDAEAAGEYIDYIKSHSEAFKDELAHLSVPAMQDYITKASPDTDTLRIWAELAMKCENAELVAYLMEVIHNTDGADDPFKKLSL